MSSELIYRMAVVKIPAEASGDYDDNFLWIAEAGSSNCYDSSGRRARDWQCLAIGHHYRVVRTVCEHAGSCEGGSLKYPGGQSCKPETLIRAYRNAEAKALCGFSQANDAGLRIDLRIRFGHKPDKSEQYHFDELVKAGKSPVEESVGWGDGTTQNFRFDPADKADLKLWLEHCHSAAWNNCEVHGPRGELRLSEIESGRMVP